MPEEGRVDVVVSLTTPGCPIRAHFEKAVEESVGALGVGRVNVGFDVLSTEEKQTPHPAARPPGRRCPRARSPR